MNQKGLAPIVIILIVIGVLVVGGGVYWYFVRNKPVACTQEAKQCPDGSYVSRIGPNCEFAPCPEAKTDETADWQTYRNKEWGYELKYPQNWNVEENTVLITTIRNWIRKPDEYSDPYRDIDIIVYPEKKEWPDSARMGLDYGLNIGTVIVDGLEGVKVRVLAERGYSYIKVAVPKGELLYTIGICENIAGESNPRMTIFDQILSNFKFISQ